MSEGGAPVAVDPARVTLVRQLIADTGTDPLLDDGHIGALLTLNAGFARLAAADALESIAASEVLVAKKIRTQDLSTDGPAVAKALMDLAASLRRRARELGEDPAAAELEEFFDIVPTTGGGRRPEHTNVEVWGL